MVSRCIDDIHIMNGKKEYKRKKFLSGTACHGSCFFASVMFSWLRIKRKQGIASDCLVLIVTQGKQIELQEYSGHTIQSSFEIDLSLKYLY